MHANLYIDDLNTWAVEHGLNIHIGPVDRRQELIKPFQGDPSMFLHGDRAGHGLSMVRQGQTPKP